MHFYKSDHRPIVQFVAQNLCEFNGYKWPCQHQSFSTKWEKEASTEWWVELAECALVAIDQYEADHGCHCGRDGHPLNSINCPVHGSSRWAKGYAAGWRTIETEVPELDKAVVCTDGTHRWLDMRTAYCPDMVWQGHKPTHWHPIQDFAPLPVATAKERKA